MAEVLDKFPHPMRRGRASKYAEWLDGEIWRINWREDTDCNGHESFRSGIHTAARGLGVSVRTQVDGDDHIIVQSYNENT